MPKIKIKPFFYLILRRDENGKMHFDVYDFTEEGGIVLKKISDDNGLLKHENKPEEIKEYVETLVEDIADVYSRMKCIFISYRGDTRDELVVKDAVNLYNISHEDDENAPVFIFKEIEGNFSIEDYIEKINYHVSNVAEKMASAEKLFSFIYDVKDYEVNENNMEISDTRHVLTTEFERLMWERGCDPEYLAQTVEWYRNEKTAKARESLFRNLVPALVLYDEREKQMFLRYLEIKADTEALPTIEKESVVIPKFSIVDSVAHNELLEYIEWKEKELEEAFEIAENAIVKYATLLDEKRKEISEQAKKLNASLVTEIEKEMDACIEQYFQKIKKSYDKIDVLEKFEFSYRIGDPLSESVLTSFGSVILLKYTDRYNNDVKPVLVDCTESLNKKVYSILSEKIGFNLSEAKGFDEDEYQLKYAFINPDTKDSFNKSITLKVDEKRLYDLIKKKPLIGKNDYSVEISKNLYKISDTKTFSAMIKQFAYSSCSKGVALNKIKTLILQRKDEYSDKVIPAILERIHAENDDGKIIEARLEINKASEMLEEAGILHRDIDLSLEEVKQIKRKFMSGGDQQ